MSRRTGRLLTATLVAGLVLSLGSAALAAPVGALKQFKVPTANSEPRAITNGSDGNVWFTEGTDFTNAPAKIGRVTPAGKITEFAANCSSCIPTDIAEGSDGIFYVTTNDTLFFLRFDPVAGTFQDPLEIPGGGSADNLAVEGDNIWLLASPGSRLVRYNITDDLFTSFPLDFLASDLAIDDAGDAWITSDGDGTVKKFDTGTGAAVDSFDTDGLHPRAITVATDQQIWFTTESPVGVARLNPDTRAVTPFLTPSEPRRPLDIAASPDGTVWFTQDAKGNIARIDNNGVLTETKVVRDSGPLGIVVDPNGNPWYTMKLANKIGTFQLR